MWGKKEDKKQHKEEKKTAISLVYNIAILFSKCNQASQS